MKKMMFIFTSVDWKTSASGAASIEETQPKKRKLPDWLYNIESTLSPKTKPSIKKEGILIGSCHGLDVLITDSLTNVFSIKSSLIAPVEIQDL